MRRSQSLSGRPSMGATRVRSDSAGRPSGGFAGLATTGRQSTSTSGNPSAPGLIGLASATRLSRGIYESGGKRSGSGFGSASQPCSKNRRASSARGFSSVEIAKDPRPISDRVFREKSIRELVEFLTLNSYPSSISMKQLLSPSAADFRKIFEFLIHFFAPKFKLVDKKLEEEVPKVLKMLGYPITIPKSYMTTIGAQHTWPTILAALSWIKTIIQTSAGYDKEEMLFPRYEHDFGRIPEKKIVYDYCKDTYKKFMSGQDEFDEERLRVEKIIVGNSRINEENEHMKREIARNKLVLEELESDTNSLGKLEDDVAHLKVDEVKMRKHLEDFEDFVRDIELNVVQIEKESVAIEKELIVVTSELKRKEEILSKQNESGVDVRGLSLERESLRRRCAAVEAELKKVDQENIEIETALVNEREMIDASTSEYNKVIQSLQTTTKSTVCAIGTFSDLAIGRTFDDKEYHHLISEICPVLGQKKKQVASHCYDLELQIQKEKESVEQIEEMIADTQELINNSVMNTNDTDQLILSKKEAHVRAMESIQAQIKSKIADMEITNPQSFILSGQTIKTEAEAEEGLNRVKNNLKKLHIKCEEAVDRRLDFLQETLEEAMKYKQDMCEVSIKSQTEFCSKIDQAIKTDIKEREPRDKLDDLLELIPN